MDKICPICNKKYSEAPALSRKDDDADTFVWMVKKLAKLFGFRLLERIRFEDPNTGKNMYESRKAEMEEKKVEIVALTKDEISNLLREAALVGAQTAADTMANAQRKEDKDRVDRRLHNTELLLRNYRALKESYQNSVYEKDETDTLDNMIEEIMSMKEDRVIVESIKKSAQRTAIMVEHIDKMLDVYRICCSKGSSTDKRRYRVIKAMYISKQQMKTSEISKKFNVSNRTIFNDAEIAKERLSVLFFGIDGLKLF